MGIYPYITLEAHLPKEILIKMPTQHNLPPILRNMAWKYPKFTFSMNIVELGIIRGPHPSFDKRCYHIKDILISLKMHTDAYNLIKGPWTGLDLSLIGVWRWDDNDEVGEIRRPLLPDVTRAIEQLCKDLDYPVFFQWVHHYGWPLEEPKKVTYSSLRVVDSGILVSENDEIRDILLTELPEIIIEDIMTYYWMRKFSPHYRLDKTYFKNNKSRLLLKAT